MRVDAGRRPTCVGMRRWRRVVLASSARAFRKEPEEATSRPPVQFPVISRCST